MQNSVKPRRWHLSAGIVVPVVLALAIMVVGVCGFVLWSTTNSDIRALQRQTKLIAHFLSEEEEVMPLTQEVMTINDDAVEATLEGDEQWMEEHLGMSVWWEYGFEQAAVLDNLNEPIYLMMDGETTDPSLFAPNLETLAPLVAELREKLAVGAVHAYLGGANDRLPAITEAAVISGVPAFVSIIAVASESGENAVEPGKEYLHVVVDYLDKEFSDYVTDQNLLDFGIFRTSPDGNPDNASVPLIGANGRIIAFFEWSPDRPGHRMLMETLPALLGALAMGAILIILLLLRIARYSAQLEAGRMEAQHRASHDALTGLPNRAYFDDCLAAVATGRSGAALLMLDLDRFKQVNDTLGHPAGDDLIRQVGQRLRQVITDGTIARLGGDEFAILERRLEGAESMRTLAARIIAAIGQPFDLSGREASVGVSIGIVRVGDIRDGAELTRKADIALYEAKAAGRNRAVIYEDRMDARVKQRHAIEADLREALRSPDQLSIAFEPIVTATGRIVGAEALPIWKHPRQGEIPPSRLLAIAESAALVEPLGELMLQKACEFARRCPEYVVSMNISQTQIRNPKFFTRVFDILDQYAVRPASIEFEIAEAILLKDQEMTADTLRKFHAAGIRIAIDEFGTGQASLNFLRQCAVDRIKIVRIDPASDTRVSLAIVQATMTLARAMGIEVAAAGLASQEQVTQLATLGCSLFQGPFFHPTMSLEAVEAKLNRQLPLVVPKRAFSIA
jgi:diguanylate cyclase (GGDEF)-like protein